MDIEKLKRLAFEYKLRPDLQVNEVAFRNAANPAAVLELIRQHDELRTALKGLVDDIHGLMSESHGVTGLHLNGDIAPWSELEAGGQFERLTHLPDAIDAIAKAEISQ